eukprot:scaffold1344_cov232-Alexandrium_tamarense.AAC.9
MKSPASPPSTSPLLRTHSKHPKVVYSKNLSELSARLANNTLNESFALSFVHRRGFRCCCSL